MVVDSHQRFVSPTEDVWNAHIPIESSCTYTTAGLGFKQATKTYLQARSQTAIYGINSSYAPNSQATTLQDKPFGYWMISLVIASRDSEKAI